MKFLTNANYDWMNLLSFSERPFRAKLVPAKVWVDLDRYKNDAKGLSNYCKKWRTKIRWGADKNPSTNHIKIGGEYDYDNRQCILDICTDKGTYGSFVFTDRGWDRFKFRLIQTLMHEMIHFMQYDRREDKWSHYVVPYKKIGNKKKDEERRYLSGFDEIQAYAHCVYLDVKMYRPNVPVDKILTMAKKRSVSYTLKYILSSFDYDFRNNVAIPKLAQQIMKWDRKYQKLHDSAV